MTRKDDLPAILGRAIEEARNGKAVSRYMLAKRLGTQQHRVTRIENGANDMRLSSVMDIIDALDITPGELLDPVAATIRGKGLLQSAERKEVEKGNS